jgi:SAM-dependent methyltransferase
MSNQKPESPLMSTSNDYWDANLDPQNIGRLAGSRKRDLEAEIVFYETPEQQAARDMMGSVEGRIVLELGGGLSVHPIILARSGALVVVADVSLKRLKVMRKLIKEQDLSQNIFLICAKAEAMPLRAETLDVVYTKSVLIHTELYPTILEIKRVLKLKGKGIFVEPLRYNPFVALYRRFFAPSEWRKITNYFDRVSIARIRSVFSDVNTQRFYLFSFLAFYWQFGRRNLGKFTAALGLLMKADKFIMSVLPFVRGLSWFVVICARKQNER